MHGREVAPVEMGDGSKAQEACAAGVGERLLA